MARSTRSAWRRRLSKWKRSGLSIPEFARREGLNPSTLSWWKWKLGSEGHATDVDFVELVPAPVSLVSAAAIEVSCPTGHVVRVPAGTDSATLRVVLETLAAR